MRILVSADTYYPQVNGASYFTQRLAEALAARHHEVAVIAPGTRARFLATPQGKVTFFQVPSFPIPFIHNFRFTLPGVTSYYARRVVAAWRPDIVHAQMHFTVSRAVIHVAERQGIPMVSTNHFMPDNLTHYLHLPRTLEKQLTRIAWRDCARILMKTNIITSPTPAAARLLAEHVTKDIRAISNGIDLGRFRPHEVSTSLIQKYNLPDTFILFVGRLDREKNIDLVIKAMPLVTDPRIHFVIAGNGNSRKELEALAEKGQRERVHFLGFVPDEDLPDLYAAAKCFINMGTAELQSIVTMEAMATALPIIGANAVALPALIHTGENGVLVEPGDLQGVASAINEVFTDDERRKAMGKTSLAQIQKHNLDEVIQLYEDLYKSLLK